MEELLKDFEKFSPSSRLKALAILMQNNADLWLKETEPKSTDRQPINNQVNDQKALESDGNQKPLKQSTEKSKSKYTTEMKKEAVTLALKYNNNTRAADEMKKKYNLKILDDSELAVFLRRMITVNAHFRVA